MRRPPPLAAFLGLAALGCGGGGSPETVVIEDPLPISFRALGGTNARLSPFLARADGREEGGRTLVTVVPRIAFAGRREIRVSLDPAGLEDGVATIDGATQTAVYEDEQGGAVLRWRATGGTVAVVARSADRITLRFADVTLAPEDASGAVGALTMRGWAYGGPTD